MLVFVSEYVCVCVCVQMKHSEQRDQDIQLIREVKVDFLVAGPITAGASVNLGDKVMAMGWGGGGVGREWGGVGGGAAT